MRNQVGPMVALLTALRAFPVLSAAWILQNGWKTPKLDEKYEPIDPRALSNKLQDKIHTHKYNSAHLNQIA
jgi:hypothetical protein